MNSNEEPFINAVQCFPSPWKKLTRSHSIFEAHSSVASHDHAAAFFGLNFVSEFSPTGHSFNSNNPVFSSIIKCNCARRPLGHSLQTALHILPVATKLTGLLQEINSNAGSREYSCMCCQSSQAVSGEKWLVFGIQRRPAHAKPDFN